MPTRRIRGRGGYGTVLKDVLHRALRAGAGKAIRTVGRRMSTYGRVRASGRGDYAIGADVVSNDLINKGAMVALGGSGSNSFRVNAANDSNDVFIEHREFVSNVYAAGYAGQPSVFSSVQYEINPGVAATFPFLSLIASNYTLYKFHGLVFHFKSTSSDSASTAFSMGHVILSTDYDPDAKGFPDARTALSTQYATSAKPNLNQLHGVETASRAGATNMLYVRTTTGTRDQVFTDVGNFQISTEGVPVTGTGTALLTIPIGELWVSYKCQLSRARLSSITSAPPPAPDPTLTSYFHRQSWLATSDNATFTSMSGDPNGKLYAMPTGYVMAQYQSGYGVCFLQPFPANLVETFFISIEAIYPNVMAPSSNGVFSFHFDGDGSYQGMIRDIRGDFFSSQVPVSTLIDQSGQLLSATFMLQVTSGNTVYAGNTPKFYWSTPFSMQPAWGNQVSWALFITRVSRQTAISPMVPLPPGIAITPISNIIDVHHHHNPHFTGTVPKFPPPTV